jgi:uncharacterized radical SAM superfamily Fe-S cluster-containing enzyme
MNAPLRKSRPYVFWGQTQSLCEICLKLVPTKIQILDNEVWYEKRCREHGVQSTLVSTDAAYWRLCKDFIKPGDRPLQFQHRTEFGCPYDCGLCPDHEQHSCLALIEITEHCNLTCPVCFAESAPTRTKFTPLATVEKMLDALVASEGEPDLVQISGGEPTLHPDFFEILDAVRARPIRHVMINTNGLRIAREKDFVARLAENKRGLEVYLQFDSLQRDALVNLRGADASRRWRISSISACRPRWWRPSSAVSMMPRSATSCVTRSPGNAFAASRSSRCRMPAATRISTRPPTASCCRRFASASSRPAFSATRT